MIVFIEKGCDKWGYTPFEPQQRLRRCTELLAALRKRSARMAGFGNPAQIIKNNNYNDLNSSQIITNQKVLPRFFGVF